MLVFAFDRDWTVDVNPHPHRDAVPLEWVRHLAHETDHAVYAIGNQMLADEAAIPGVVDIVGHHSDDWEEWLGEKQPDGYYEQFPTRRERLALIADLHPTADDYIVVDDIDLRDVDGWGHYHAWEFVPAVERGEIDPTLPWARDPVPDGGFPTAAGIMPVDSSDLRSFLDEHSDAPAYELTYTDGDDEKTQLFWRVSQYAVWLEQPSARPAIQCTPLDPGGDPFIVDLEAIEMLSVVDPPSEAFTSRATTPTEKATALRRLADAKPEMVRVSSVLSLLDREDPLFHLTSAQVHLYLAEANVRGWDVPGTAASHYRAGVRQAMEKLADYGPGAEISDAAITEYLNENPFKSGGTREEKLEQINEQYWAATFMDGLEAWSNWRRSGYPELEPVPVDAEGPGPGGGLSGNDTNGEIPRRLRYSEDEVQLNTESLQQVLDRQGPNEMNTRVWWDVEQ